jgi:ATP-binding cassette, subfamily B, bacterial
VPPRLQAIPQRLLQTFKALSALKLVWRSSRKLAIAHLLLMLMQSGFSLASLYLTKLVIDQLSRSFSHGTAGQALALSQTALLPVALLLLLAGSCMIATQAATTIDKSVTKAQGLKLTEYMQRLFFERTILADIEHYENPNYYSTVGLAQKEVQRPSTIMYNTTTLVQNLLSLVGVLALLATIHWVTIPILVLSSLPTMLAQLRYGHLIYHWDRRKMQLEGQLGYLSGLVASAGFAKEQRLFGLGPLFSQRFLRLQRQYHTEQLEIERRRVILYVMAQTLGSVMLLVLYGLMAMEAVRGRLQLGGLVMYHQAFQFGKSSLQNALNALSALHEDSLYLNNLNAFLKLEPKVKEPLHPEPIPRPMQQGIVFEQVDFSYGSSRRDTLQDINLTIRPGEVIALVGANGSGKTTLIKLLCRLYEPTAGRITLDGIDLRDFNTSALRQEISVVFQDFARYELTAQENIWLGNIDLPPDDRRIQVAAQQAGADAVIDRLPRGYNTYLGHIFEPGEELSGGQWQKMALARAFFRDAQLVVLDEPTSALDAKAEEAVFENFRRLIQGRSAILISHRLSTVKMADRIYVLDQGKIVESGTHHELIQYRGHYHELYTLQANPYRL